MMEPTPLSNRIIFSAVTDADFDELVALRIAAMRASLERVGRFDPDRARERLRKSFYPEHTRIIILDGQRIGFYTFRPADDGFQLDHLYVHPSCQARGIGFHVLGELLSQADALQRPVRLGALRDSASNRFYQRHGFVQTAEDEWDIYYIRMPLPNAPSDSPEAVVQRQLDAYNARDVDALMATYAGDAQQFEYPATLLASGVEQLRERAVARFREPNLHAKLLQRIVAGPVVIDHEEVTRTFPEGPGKLKLVAIYEVRDGRIATARFIYGQKTLDPKSDRLAS